MVLNDITNDSVATGAESDIHRDNNEGMQRKTRKCISNVTEIGSIISHYTCLPIGGDSTIKFFVCFLQFSIKGKHDRSSYLVAVVFRFSLLDYKSKQQLKACIFQF